MQTAEEYIVGVNSYGWISKIKTDRRKDYPKTQLLIDETHLSLPSEVPRQSGYIGFWLHK